jgi:RNA polymerase sigma factor FliA
MPENLAAGLSQVEETENTSCRGAALPEPGCRKKPEAAREASAKNESERRRERDELTLRLIGLVRRVALEMRDRLPAHVDVDDLVSAGTLGLMEAVKRFESGKQVKIETYARYRIRGAILDALRDLDPASRDMRRKNKQAERLFHELCMRLGRPATDAEMAEAMHVSLQQWYQMVNEFRSLGVEWLRPRLIPNTHCPDQDNLPAIDQPDPFQLCYLEEQRGLLRRALDNVSERDRQILTLYYERNLTMKQIAGELGIDESRVSQIHSSILHRLRDNVQSMTRPVVSEAARIAA